MSATSRLILKDRIAEVARRAASREGIDLWDVELLGSGPARTLRIYIDKAGGVTHADCELISQQVGAVLDVEDIVPGGSYHLEVSSPGVERRLTRIEHYTLCSGKKVRLSLKEPEEGRKRIEGAIVGVEGDAVVIDTGEKQMTLRLDDIEKANLKFEW
jgi:ribosome maturation factor RimP